LSFTPSRKEGKAAISGNANQFSSYIFITFKSFGSLQLVRNTEREIFLRLNKLCDFA
jgi:hypothetical protein